MAHMNHRRAEVPQAVLDLGDQLTKADLLEMAYHLASTVERMLEEANILRTNRGAAPLKLRPPTCPHCKGKGTIRVSTASETNTVPCSWCIDNASNCR